MTHTALKPHFDARELRDVFGTFATGVTVVTAVRADGEPVGMTANSFTSVSIDPPLVLWCLSVRSKSISAFSPGAPFSVHVLAHDQRELAVHFARGGRERFDIDPYWRENPRPPHIAGVLSRLDCRVHSSFLAGDHWIIVGDVLAAGKAAGEPLAFHGGLFGRFEVETCVSQAEAWHTVHGEWF
jgi:flavin reductase (DIM6/NTAB) family NADH-FMN oxidoreductase RutF